MLPTVDLLHSNVVQGQLAPGEQPLWAAGESPGRAFSRLASSLQLPLAWIFLSAFLLFFFLSSDIQWGDQDNQKIAPYFLAGFVLVGLFLLAACLRRFWQSGKRIYLVTNQAAWIIDSGPKGLTRRFEPQELQTIEVKQGRNGSGDLIFDRVVHYTATDKGGRSGR
jgi:hypothetical protein